MALSAVTYAESVSCSYDCMTMTDTMTSVTTPWQ